MVYPVSAELLGGLSSLFSSIYSCIAKVISILLLLHKGYTIQAGWQNTTQKEAKS